MRFLCRDERPKTAIRDNGPLQGVVQRRTLTPWTPTMSIGWHADRRRTCTPNNSTPAPSDAACCDRCARSVAKRSRKRAKNARSRQRYVHRRVRGLCIDCAAPSQGASRCPPCARRSWARSGEHRGLPVLPPRVTVIETATGVNHATWDRWEDVVMCLAFAKLSRDQVELIPDM